MEHYQENVWLFSELCFSDRSLLPIKIHSHASVLLLHTIQSALNLVRRLAEFEADVAGFGEKSGDIF